MRILAPNQHISVHTILQTLPELYCGSLQPAAIMPDYFLKIISVYGRIKEYIQVERHMTITRRNSLFAVNVIVPLVCGLFIYLTKPEATYVSAFLSRIRLMLPVIRYPLIINHYAADFLWTYSLFFCLRLTLGDALKGKHSITVIVITAVTSVILESLQLLERFPGTFDPWDIVAELSAVAIAFLISVLIEKKCRSQKSG